MAIKAKDLRVKKEIPALLVCFTVFAIVMAVGAFYFISIVLMVMVSFIIWLQQSSLIGMTAMVSERQFPEIYDIAKEAAERLDMKQPAVYVLQDPTINAFAMGFLAKKSVVLHSATIEGLTRDELAFIIGHEFTHIKCGHTSLLVLTAPTQMLRVFGVSWLLQQVFRAWSRQAEYTSDQGGMYVSRNPVAAVSAMCKLAVGPKLFEQMDVAHFLEQKHAMRKNAMSIISESMFTHPYTVKRVQAMLDYIDTDAYRRLFAIEASDDRRALPEKRMAGYCSECDQYVFLAEDGSCARSGHAAGSISDTYAAHPLQPAEA